MGESIAAKNSNAALEIQRDGLTYVQRSFMTNTTLRERLGIEDRNSATASRIIKETTLAGFIRCHDDSVGSKAKKYLPWWA